MRRNKFVFAFLMSTGGIILMLASQMRARDLGAPPLWLGLQTSASLGMYVLGNAFIGRLIRRLPRRGLLAAGPVVAIASTLLLWRLGDYRLFPIVLGMQGLAGSLFWAPLEVTIAEETHPERLSGSVGWFNLSWTGAQVVGSSLCGALYEVNSSAPFILAAIIFPVLIALLAITRFVPRLPAERADDAPDAVPAHVAIMHRRLAWVAIFAQGFLAFTLLALTPKITKMNGFPDVVPGLLIGLRSASLFAMFLLMSRWHRWHYRVGGLVAAQIVGALAVLVIAIRPGELALLLAAFPITGFAYAYCYYASILYSMADHRTRDVHSARHELVVGLGPVFGPPVVGAAATLTGNYGFSLSICAAVILAAVAIEIVILRAAAKTNAPDGAP